MGSHSPAVRQLFQIGNLTLHTHVLEFVDINITAGGQSQQFQDSHRILLSNSSYKPQLRKETIKLLIFNDGLNKSDTIIQKLANMSGKPIDFISYIMLNPPDAVSGYCCSCNCCDCSLLWLHNFGRIMDFTVTAQAYDSFIATISFEYIGYWKPLNRLLWKPTREPIFNIYVEERPFIHNIQQKLNGFPDCQSIFGRSCWGFQKVNFESIEWLYDPEYWFYTHCYFPEGYPATASWTYWETALDIERDIWVDEKLWSAPPLSIYQVKNYNDITDILTIDYVYNVGFNIETSELSLDFQVIEEAYENNGYSYSSNDRLFFGDLDGFAYVKRGDTILFYVVDAINYTNGDFPGMIPTGMIRQNMNTAGAAIAQIHIFRRM